MNLEKQELVQRVQAAIDTIRPHLVADSGDIELVDISPEGRVLLRWLGSCESCSMNTMTRAGIEHIIKSRVPEVQSVEMDAP